MTPERLTMSSVIKAFRFAAGAATATPSIVSSCAYSAARSAANRTAWPPCECPHSTTLSLTPAPSMRRAARTMSSTLLDSGMPSRYDEAPSTPSRDSRWRRWRTPRRAARASLDVLERVHPERRCAPCGRPRGGMAPGHDRASAVGNRPVRDESRAPDTGYPRPPDRASGRSHATRWCRRERFRSVRCG